MEMIIKGEIMDSLDLVIVALLMKEEIEIIITIIEEDLELLEEEDMLLDNFNAILNIYK